jgi:hypothetical protein
MNFKDCTDDVLNAFIRAGSALLDLLDESEFADELAGYIEDCSQELTRRHASFSEEDTKPFQPLNPAVSLLH